MSFLIVELQYFYLQRVAGILKFWSRSKLSAQWFSLEHSKIPVEKKTTTTHDSRLSKSHLSLTSRTILDDNSIQRDDLEVLMADLGVFCRPGGEKLPEMLNSTDIFNVFEEEQPRLDEVKEAFDVFDENRDGFIDAWELQRVVSVLGLKKRAEIDDCRKMIGAFDENADGRIDFNEFVKFMESTFC